MVPADPEGVALASPAAAGSRQYQVSSLFRFAQYTRKFWRALTEDGLVQASEFQTSKILYYSGGCWVHTGDSQQTCHHSRFYVFEFKLIQQTGILFRNNFLIVLVI